MGLISILGPTECLSEMQATINWDWDIFVWCIKDSGINQSFSLANHMYSAQCSPITVHSTLHIAHFTLNNAHCTTHTAHLTLHTAHWTLHTANWAINNEHSTLHNTHQTLHTQWVVIADNWIDGWGEVRAISTENDWGEKLRNPF